MPVYQKRIDWTKPNLRLVYLIEGFCRDRYGQNPQVIRWCGPPSRTGSGFVAHPTLSGPGGHPPGLGKHAHPAVAWEARLSRCSFDWTLGGLNQHVQPLSQITMQVAIGDDDAPTSSISTGGLRELAMRGRWMGNRARLILVDADEIERFEVLSDGTWDRDPDALGPRGFKMAIDSGEILPPTLRWPSARVPRVTTGFQVFSYSSDTYSPTDFSLNPNQKGKHLGQIFGGAVHSTTVTIEDEVWRELVPYGDDGTYDFALVSPRFDQFCYDIVVETDDRLVKISTVSIWLILVFNNDDPLRGPVGTCVKFNHVNGFKWASEQRRVWGKVAGGVPLNRPSGYSPISYSGNPTLGTNMPGGGEATPSNPTEPQVISSSVIQVLRDIFGDGHFLGEPGELHPDALTDLASAYAFLPLPDLPRIGAVPNDLTDKSLYYRGVLEPLMMSIPADLVMRWDAAANRRKYYPQIRQFPTQSAQHVFTLGDLADSGIPANVTQHSDPDGYYSNETTVTTAEYYTEPIWDADDPKMEVKQRDVMELTDIAQQSASGVSQIIEGEVELEQWRLKAESFPSFGRTIEQAKSQPQRVLTAVHGYRSMRLELGTIVAYNIHGVLTDPGQVRGMRFDLDKQTVTVRTYHQQATTKTNDLDSTIKDANVVTAEGRTPERDRRE